MSFNFFLMTETSFHASYLVTRWLETFEHVPGFKGIIVREKPISNEIQNLREHFHQEHQGQLCLKSTAMIQLKEIYPELSETESAMIRLFGVPAHAATSSARTVFLGSNLNNSLCKQWLTQICAASDAPPFLFVFLDQILDSWWIELTSAQIINGHSAVLPYARGMFAIENVAISQNIHKFRKAAGATVHYIDTNVDTGPIIRAERLIEPFRFDSLWELKAFTFTIVFDLLIQVAKSIFAQLYTVPVGSHVAPELYGPAFLSKNFTLEARKKAEIGYLNMKHASLVQATFT